MSKEAKRLLTDMKKLPKKEREMVEKIIRDTRELSKDKGFMKKLEAYAKKLDLESIAERIVRDE